MCMNSRHHTASSSARLTPRVKSGSDTASDRANQSHLLQLLLIQATNPRQGWFTLPCQVPRQSRPSCWLDPSSAMHRRHMQLGELRLLFLSIIVLSKLGSAQGQSDSNDAPRELIAQPPSLLTLSSDPSDPVFVQSPIIDDGGVTCLDELPHLRPSHAHAHA